jgi:hypothetical protein
MISIYNYYIAKKRLLMAKETIQLMGGENDCQPMMLGQRDMLELEIDYHKSEMVKLGYICLILAMASVIIYTLHYKGFIIL